MRVLCVLALAALLAVTPAGAAPGPRGAFFRSLILPGWGQRATGRPAAAAWFFGAELSLWGGHLGMRHLAAVREEEYRSYAAAYAGARMAGKGRTFCDDLGFYSSVQEHNQHAAYYDGPTAALYPMTPEFFWEWDTDAARLEYRRLRNSSRGADRQALYVAGVAVLNHVLAAVHAARTASAAGDASRTPAAAPALAAACELERGLVWVAWTKKF